MKTLVLAEHNNSELSAATLSVVEAAKKLGKVFRGFVISPAIYPAQFHPV